MPGDAGLAGADTRDSSSAEAHVDEVAQVTDNAITDSGNLSLDNILNGDGLEREQPFHREIAA